MKTAGIVLLVLGMIGTVVFGIQAIQNSETLSLFGLDIALSSANWTPVIISVVVLIAGIIITNAAKRHKT